MKSIDLNCDMGESFGNWKLGDDEALMDYVSSVNIACGFHAGDASVMRKTVDMAARKKLAIGAHPGYPDLQGFGRRSLQMSGEEVYDIVLYQVGALMAFAKASGTHLYHVKPHGALYNSAAKDPELAAAIARAIFDLDSTLVMVGLSGSHLIKEGIKQGLKTAEEVFADRTYQDDGTLTPRTHPKAMLEGEDAAAQQVLQIVEEQTVTSLSGKKITVKADTVCIHGDGKNALAFAKTIHALLRGNHVNINRP